MAKPTKKVVDRFRTQLKKYQKILKSAKSRDINESDTVLIIGDMLTDMFGYEKYSDITTEYQIRGTYCDLAVKIDDKIHFLIEAKAIGIDLKEQHMRQAVNYAAKEGIDWVILTNGTIWQVYKLIFQKPIEHEQIFEFNLLEVNTRDPYVLEMLFLLSKEGIAKSAIDDFHQQQQAMNRYTITAIILNDVVINGIRRELRRMHKGLKIDKDRLLEIISNDVIKRDIIEDERTQKEAKKILKQALKASNRKKNQTNIDQSTNNQQDG